MQNIMNLSNDESTFSYGEITETNHENSHTEEEYIMEDGGMYFSCNSNDKSDIIMIENVDQLNDPMVCVTGPLPSPQKASLKECTASLLISPGPSHLSSDVRLLS